MNIRQLKQFISIAETGSISRSAEDQNISQPALTRSIKNLEDDMAADLIERRPNGVVLTDCGKHLLDYAHCIVNDSERVKREVQAMKTGTRGRLCIGVGPYYCDFAPSILDKLLSEGSHLEVRIVEGFVEGLCSELRSGSLDVVLSLFPNNFESSDLVFTDLCSLDSVLAANAHHKLAGLKDVSMDQIANCNWVIADQQSSAHAFHEFLGSTLIPSYVHHIRVNSADIMKSLVKDSDYLTILPKAMIEHELRTGELVVIDAPVKPLVSKGAMVTRKSGFHSAGLMDFMRIIKEDFV